MERAGNKASRILSTTLWRMLVPCLLASLPASAIAKSEVLELSPCLTVKSSLDAYVKAFETSGWIRTTGGSDAHIRAAKASGEIIWTGKTVPGPFQSDKESREFLETAQTYGQNVTKDQKVALLSDGDRNLMIQFLGFSSEKRLTCLMTARELLSVRKTLRSPGIMRSGASLPFGLVQVPYLAKSNVFTQITMLRLFLPHSTENLLAGGDAIEVRMSFDLTKVKN